MGPDPTRLRSSQEEMRTTTRTRGGGGGARPPTREASEGPARCAVTSDPRLPTGRGRVCRWSCQACGVCVARAADTSEPDFLRSLRAGHLTRVPCTP